MKKLCSLFTVSIFLSVMACCVVNAQGIAINNTGMPPDSSAMMDINASNKGLLMPRLTTAQRDAIVNPAVGLFIFNTDCKVVNFNAGTPANPSWATLNSSNALQAGVSIVANPLGAICAGTSVTFSATPGQNNLSPSYQWQVNGNNVGTNSDTYTSSGLNNGDVVTCILTSSVPCVTGSPATSNTITMLVNTVPAITGTTPTGFCSGSAVTLSASANIGTINWYSDSTGGSSLSSGASFTVSGLNGTTTYYVDATANGCTTASRKPVTATFYPYPPGQPGAITGPVNVDGDSVTTYSVSALPNTATYAWAVTMGTITSGQGTNTITVTWGDSAGFGSVSVAATNACGTSASQSIVVGVQAFFYTGSQQVFTVPTDVTSVTIAAYGAQGSNNNGGLGGLATGTLSVTPGSVLYVFVGGQTGYNGGGQGGGGNYNGGGESDVRQGGTSINNWVIVAGGGGGGSNSGGVGGAGGGGDVCANGAGGGGGTSGDPPYGGPGNAGTCTNGGNGGSSSSGWTGGGGGGGLTSGGGGSTGGGYGNSGGSGTQGIGGDFGTNSGCGCGYDAAGGGGGYYGGGGTADGCCAGGSGGGGSSWTAPSMTNVSFSGGVQSGNGKVLITW